VIAHPFEGVAGAFGLGNLVFHQLQGFDDGGLNHRIGLAHQGGETFFFNEVKRFLAGIIAGV
jgi:hypothetical protein